MNKDMSKPDPSNARRYLFDLAFDGEINKDGKHQKINVTFSEEEMEAAKNAAYQKGVEDGEKKASSDQNHRMELLLKNIDCQIGQTTNESTEFWGHQLRQLQKIVLMIAKKVLPAYSQKYGLSEIEAVVMKVMAEMGQEPRLVFRVAEDQFDQAKERIDTIAAQAAYAGKIVILGDKELETSECRVEWADGGIERDLKKLWEDIDTVMAEVQTLEEEDTPHKTEPCPTNLKNNTNTETDQPIPTADRELKERKESQDALPSTTRPNENLEKPTLDHPSGDEQ